LENKYLYKAGLRIRISINPHFKLLDSDPDVTLWIGTGNLKSAKKIILHFKFFSWKEGVAT
jgi:hypothetical protein